MVPISRPRHDVLACRYFRSNNKIANFAYYKELAITFYGICLILGLLKLEL